MAAPRDPDEPKKKTALTASIVRNLGKKVNGVLRADGKPTGGNISRNKGKQFTSMEARGNRGQGHQKTRRSDSH